jgi:hypothetical protein
VGKRKRVDVYLEVRKRMGHIFLNETSQGRGGGIHFLNETSACAPNVCLFVQE